MNSKGRTRVLLQHRETVLARAIFFRTICAKKLEGGNSLSSIGECQRRNIRRAEMICVPLPNDYSKIRLGFVAFSGWQFDPPNQALDEDVLSLPAA